MESTLAAHCAGHDIKYGLTAFSAAARMAPAVRYQRVFAYVDGPIEEVAAELGLKSVDSGANVSLLKPYDAGVFYGAQKVGGIWTVSSLQAYLDLANLKGRGQEAAAVIRKEMIESEW
jgi:hypothetical protein